MRTVVAEQGLAGLWRGNMANCVRVIPYSGLQFAGYGWFKENLFGIQEKDAKLTVPQRLTCGASAAMVATSFTHPLDLVRLRLAVQPELKGTMDAFRSIWVEGGIRAYFKGLAPTLISLSPFIAINFATFDTLKDVVFGDIPREQQSKLTVLGLGATAGLFAQSICYPLDTVRRRMQMKGNAYSSVLNAFQTILKVEGSAGFYRGFTANAMKVVPNNGLRFMAFDFLKDKLMKKDDE
jgi:solute carrier family 25 phosphate transporter 23/24/25/41